MRWLPSPPNLSDTDDCHSREFSNVCTLVNTEVTLTHTPNLEDQAIKYELLKRKDDVVASIEDSGFGQLVVHYVGDVSLDTSVVISLEGVPEREMGMGQTYFFEKFARSFLNQQMEQDSESGRGVKVLTIRVKQQEIHTGDAYRPPRLLSIWRGLWQRRLPVSSGATVDITATITGEHRPPPHIEFDSLVEDSFDRDGHKFTDDLKTEATRALDEDDALFFKEVQDVKARVVLSIAPTTAPTTINNTTVVVVDMLSLPHPIIVGSALGVALVFGGLIALCLFLRKRRKPTPIKGKY